MRNSIDINCDMGERDSIESVAMDELIMPYISSCNISCGAHAGNEDIISATLQKAKKHKLRIGAHPSYPDRQNFGRKSMNISFEELKSSVGSQIRYLEKLADLQDIKLSYIKPHGALYNDLCRDSILRNKFIEFIDETFPEYSIMLIANLSIDKDYIQEAFGDRKYKNATSLVSRSESNALIQSRDDVTYQLENLLKNEVIDEQHRKHKITVDSICVHSDTPNALEIVKWISDYLKSNNVRIDRHSGN